MKSKSNIMKLFFLLNFNINAMMKDPIKIAPEEKAKIVNNTPLPLKNHSHYYEEIEKKQKDNISKYFDNIGNFDKNLSNEDKKNAINTEIRNFIIKYQEQKLYEVKEILDNLNLDTTKDKANDLLKELKSIRPSSELHVVANPKSPILQTREEF